MQSSLQLSWLLVLLPENSGVLLRDCSCRLLSSCDLLAGDLFFFQRILNLFLFRWLFFVISFSFSSSIKRVSSRSSSSRFFFNKKSNLFFHSCWDICSFFLTYAVQMFWIQIFSSSLSVHSSITFFKSASISNIFSSCWYEYSYMRSMSFKYFWCASSLFICRRKSLSVSLIFGRYLSGR